MQRSFERVLAALAISAAISCSGTSFTASGSGTGGAHSGDAGVGGASGSGANAGTGASGSGSGGDSGAGGGIASGGGKSTGGAAGSGGTASTGGTSSGGTSAGGAGGRGGGGTAGSSSGGASGAGGVPTCGPDVSFKIVPGGPAGMAQFCTGAPNMCGAGVSITVLDAEGKMVTMGLGCGMRDCASCIDTGCPAICGFSTLIPSSGLGITWPGARWLPGTCGENVACVSPSCAEHGSYVARMCGYAMTGTAGAGGVGGGAGAIPVSPCEQLASKTPTCVDVPFEYPASGVVSGVLDPRK